LILVFLCCYLLQIQLSLWSFFINLFSLTVGMVRETLLLSYVERHHFLVQEDGMRFFKGCVPCWISEFRERFSSVRYSWHQLRPFIINDPMPISARGAFNDLHLDISRFTCPHVDRWFDTSRVGWSVDDETRMRSFVDALGPGYLRIYLNMMEYEHTRYPSDILPRHQHWYVAGGRWHIGWTYVAPS
jgi:hypothetical protein